MKVYYAVKSLYSQKNPYTRTLANGLSQLDSSIEFVWEHDYFWTEEIFTCDIVHIHWPEQLLMFGNYSSDEFRERLGKIKNAGVKIVVTCHNLAPHKKKNDERIACYNAAYSMADVIVHLGHCSFELFKKKYEFVRNVEIPHHVYDQVYTSIPSRDDAVARLKLNTSKKYILCFGQFRNDEERTLVSNVYKTLKNDGIRVLAPAFSPVLHRRKNVFQVLKSWVNYLRYSILYPGIKKCSNLVPDEELPYYYAAADICLIQRKDILNSGNLPMALLMGNVVVGPNVGNVGQILLETGNYSFNPESPESILDSVKLALSASKEKGAQNRQWAQSNLLTSIVCEKLLAVYKNLM